MMGMTQKLSFPPLCIHPASSTASQSICSMVYDRVDGGQLSAISGRTRICVSLFRNRPTGMPVCTSMAGQGSHTLAYCRRNKDRR